MRRHKIVSGGERVGKALLGGPALRVKDQPESVLRRSGRRPTRLSFSRRNERPYDWGRTPPRSALREALDFVLFAGVFVGVGLLALHVAMGRA